jgi:oxalate decarboxylase/phosphoglucose isomerase-like protein (cupin superfamily)
LELFSQETNVETRADRLRVGSDQITLHVTSGDSGGALLAAEVSLPAGGGPPALHRHAPEEVYRLERGELAIYLEDDEGDVRRISAQSGAVVHIPGGRAHTVRNESGTDALAYVIFAPGTEIERFLRAADDLAAQGEPGIENVLALAQRHGIEMAGPVPDQPR